MLWGQRPLNSSSAYPLNSSIGRFTPWLPSLSTAKYHPKSIWLHPFRKRGCCCGKKPNKTKSSDTSVQGPIVWHVSHYWTKGNKEIPTLGLTLQSPESDWLPTAALHHSQYIHFKGIFLNLTSMGERIHTPTEETENATRELRMVNSFYIFLNDTPLSLNQVFQLWNDRSLEKHT